MKMVEHNEIYSLKLMPQYGVGNVIPLVPNNPKVLCLKLMPQYGVGNSSVDYCCCSCSVPKCLKLMPQYGVGNLKPSNPSSCFCRLKLMPQYGVGNLSLTGQQRCRQHTFKTNAPVWGRKLLVFN